MQLIHLELSMQAFFNWPRKLQMLMEKFLFMEKFLLMKKKLLLMKKKKKKLKCQRVIATQR